VPELLAAMKRVVDKRPEHGQYLLTGSQHLSVLRSVPETLAGRVGIIELENMSFYEEHEETTNWVQTYLDEPRQIFERFKGILSDTVLMRDLWRGSFPGLIDKPDRAIFDFFRSYVTTYVERDVRLVEDIENLSLYVRLMGLLAALTAHRWLQTLHYTYQWREVWPYSGNLIKRVSKKRKGYMRDTGMICYLQRIPSHEALLGHPLLGPLFETFCVNTIFKLLAGLPFEVNVYHWRSAHGAEVDLLLEYNNTFYPIEFKCKASLNRYDARGLQSFREAYPELNIREALILYTGSIPYWVDNQTLAWPWNAKITFTH
jgi:hypothetical protein